MVRCLALLALAACGRLGFDGTGGPSSSDDTPGTPDDGAMSVADGPTSTSDGAMPDSPPPMIACADMNLGSALGPSVASGSIAGTGNQYTSCSGDGEDITFGWFAPAAGNYRIDLCGSDQFWDSALSVRDGSCTGQSLACDDDSCGGAAGIQGRVTVTLAAGQGIVIIVDSVAPQNGNYKLAITQL